MRATTVSMMQRKRATAATATAAEADGATVRHPWFRIACLLYLSAWLCTLAYFFTGHGQSDTGTLVQYGIGIVGLVPLALLHRTSFRTKLMLLLASATIAVLAVRFQWYVSYGIDDSFREPLWNFLFILKSLAFILAPFCLFLTLPDRRGKWKTWAKLLWSIPFFYLALAFGSLTTRLPYEQQMPAAFAAAALVGIASSVPFLAKPVIERGNILVLATYAGFMGVAWWSLTVGSIYLWTMLVPPVVIPN